MAEENENRPANTEVLGSDGNNLSPSGPLSDIFSKIEEGKSEGKSAEEVLKQAPIVQETKEGSVKESGSTPSLVNPKAESKQPEEKPEEKQKESDNETQSQEGKKPEDSGLEGKLKERDEEITRESLRRSTKKPEPKTQEKEDAPKEDITDDDLRPLPHDTPKTTKRIHGLLAKVTEAQNIVATTKKEVEEKDARLKELEAELAKAKSSDPKTQEEIKSQLNELTMLRRKYELDNDPEIKTRFDAKVDAAESSIIDILKAGKAGQPLLDLIKEEGGWAKFASSKRPVTLDDGRQVTTAELAEIISSSLPYQDRKNLEAAATEQIQVKRDRDRFVKEETANADKYFEERRKQVEAATKQQQERLAEIDKTVKAAYADAVEKSGWLKPKEIPSDADPELKKEIEEDNAHTLKLQKILQKSLATTNVKDAVEICFDSVRYYEQLRQTEKLQSQLESLKQQISERDAALTKYKTAGRSVPRGGSISSQPASSDRTPPKPASLEDAFDRISRGEVITTYAE